MSGEKLRAVDEGVPHEAWRKVSPVSPLLNTWSAMVIVFSFIIYNVLQSLDETSATELSYFLMRATPLVIGVLIFLVLVVIVALYCWLAWTKTSFAVTDQAVWFRKGIVFRSQRHTRLERIQAVDVVHPVIPRIFGLGQITVEVAGAADSSLTIGFLRNAQLEELRADILARAAGLRSAPFEPAPGGQPEQAPIPAGPAGAMAAPERELYRVPVGVLLGSLILNISISLTLVGMLVFAGILIAGFFAGRNSLWGLIGFLPVLIGLGSVIWNRFAGEFNFKASVSPDGIRVRRGLLETRAQTIPPHRVHVVQISQPFLWRMLGWYRVTINQAGYDQSADGDNRSGGDVLLPVGNRNQALLALWLVFPDLGVEDPAGFLETALDGAGPERGFTKNPASSRIFDPLVYRRRGLATTGNSVVIRDGRISRRTTFMQFARIQSLGISQGPWERRRGLATLHAHAVPGAIVPNVPHLDVDQAAERLGFINHLTIVHRDVEPPERWMTRINQPGLDGHLPPTAANAIGAS